MSARAAGCCWVSAAHGCGDGDLAGGDGDWAGGDGGALRSLWGLLSAPTTDRTSDSLPLVSLTMSPTSKMINFVL